jgi:hypothetical protein
LNRFVEPEEAPNGLKISSVDFETIKLSWISPNEESWNCDKVVYVVDFVNTTSKGDLVVASDSNELLLKTLPGTQWQIKMRTQTVEAGQKPQHSPWSDKATLTAQALPGTLYSSSVNSVQEKSLCKWSPRDQRRRC